MLFVGLAGQTLKEQALADSIVDTVTEVLTAVLTAQFEPVPEDEKVLISSQKNAHIFIYYCI